MGSADSLEAVENASRNGSRTYLINRCNGIREKDHHTAEDEDNEECLGSVQREDQFAQISEDAEAFVADGRGHRAEDSERREEHHVVRVPEHYFGKRFAELHHRARLQAHSGAGRAEDEGENDNLEHFALRHRIDDAGGKSVLEDLRQAGALRRHARAAPF